MIFTPKSTLTAINVSVKTKNCVKLYGYDKLTPDHRPISHPAKFVELVTTVCTSNNLVSGDRSFMCYYCPSPL